MDKKAQEYEASTGKHYSCGQEFCKQCGNCSHCFCTCKRVRKIQIGVVLEDGIIRVYSDRPDEVEVVIADIDGDSQYKTAGKIYRTMQEV